MKEKYKSTPNISMCFLRTKKSLIHVLKVNYYKNKWFFCLQKRETEHLRIITDVIDTERQMQWKDQL
jgi:aminopeptidase-like protein